MKAREKDFLLHAYRSVAEAHKEIDRLNVIARVLIIYDTD